MDVTLFSTVPSSAGLDAPVFRRRLREVVRWSEAAGCRGALVYTDNSLVDPWPVAQLVIEQSQALTPLVAVQPVYMHPYTVAKTIASLGYLHGRGVDLNMVAGGFVNDLRGLDDATPHDRRYDRLREYTEIVKRLLEGETLKFEGEFYRVDRVRLAPAPDPGLVPWIFVSGSSAAGIATGQALGALVVQYPTPPGERGPQPVPEGVRKGIRVGIVAREHEDEAWRVARARFPEDRRGQLAHQLATRTSDSLWHHELASAPDPGAPYWLVPFRNYKTFCPYLVGAHDTVGHELARWLRAGYTTFILDIPAEPDDLPHTRAAFARALAEAS